MTSTFQPPSEQGLRGRCAIVTGGGKGIGRAIALALGRAGMDVALAARSRERIESVASELRALGVRAAPIVTDVTSEPDVAAAVERTLAELGAIDLLVNNAGIAGPTALARDVDSAAWNETIAVNLTGAFLCAKHASASMIGRRRGVIVNISSVAGRIGYALRTPYAASKWGMIGLSHSLAAELGPHGIRVNVVLPGATRGERLTRVVEARAAAEGKSVEDAMAWFTRDTPLGRLVTEDEVAEAVLFLASDAASGIHGQALAVCGGFIMR